MKKKIQIEDEYDSKLKLKRNVSKIVDLLFSMDEVTKNYSLKNFEFSTLSFDILLTDDDTIKKINKEYRKKDAPTDVITFALFVDGEEKFIFNKTLELGEIIVSIDTAKRQAKESLQKEVLTLICHGILHLLGFDHLNDKDYNFVVKIQEAVISKI